MRQLLLFNPKEIPKWLVHAFALKGTKKGKRKEKIYICFLLWVIVLDDGLAQ